MILAVFIYYVSKNLGTIEHTVSVTLSQSLGYVLLSFIFVLLGFYFLILMNKKTLKIAGIERSMAEAALLRSQALAINVLVPSGGVSVGVVFATDAKKRGDTEGAAITGVILALLADYAAIVLLLIIAMAYMASVGSLGWPVIVPALAFFALSIGLSLLIFFAGRNQKLLRTILDWSKIKLNKLAKLFHREKFIKSETVVDSFINELKCAYLAIAKDQKQIYLACFYALVSHFMLLVSIYILFISLGIDPLYRVLISGYAVGVMLVVISPTPNGVGIVEGAMALAYSSMGIPGAAAATVTLIFRGLSFWLPLFIGFFALQRKHLLELIESRKK